MKQIISSLDSTVFSTCKYRQMKWSLWVCIILPLNSLTVLLAFDMYPWGKYDFKEYSADLLDGMREYEHLKVWDSTLLNNLNSDNSLLIKNSEGNTFELKVQAFGKELSAAVQVQMTDLSAISATLQSNCALLVDGYWSYEWCHM